MGPVSIGLSVATGGVCYAAYATMWPSSQIWGTVTARGPANSKGVAITFDDGPTPQGTELALDALKQAGARATFFVIGQNVKKYPDLLRRMDAEGHLIGIEITAASKTLAPGALDALPAAA